MLGRKETIVEISSRSDKAAERNALRDLLNSFNTEPETLLEKTLRDPGTRQTIGKIIGHTFVKPYSGEK